MQTTDPLENGSMPWPWRVKKKPHNKSRAGCEYCKKRKVKCNEVKPVCESCQRFSLPCTYTSALDSCASTDSNGQDYNGGDSKRKGGRPRKAWSASGGLPDAVQTYPEIHDGSQSPLSQLNVGDLELFHHFILHTAQQFSIPSLWQEKVPQMAFKVPCILHLILALSALHLAIDRPQDNARYEKLADEHYAKGLPPVTQMMQSLNKEDAPVLFIAANVICVSCLVRRPTPGHLLVIAEDHEVAWFDLFRGVRYIIDTVGPEAIFGPLGTLGSCFQSIKQDYSEDHVIRESKWEEQFKALTLFVSGATQAEFLAYQNVLESLARCFRATFGTTEEPKRGWRGDTHVVMLWMYDIQDDYITHLKRRKPIALVLLAHFAVALRSIETKTLGRGWSRHILNGIKDILDLSFIHWLHWPISQIEELEAFSQRGDELRS